MSDDELSPAELAIYASDEACSDKVQVNVVGKAR
jgi:hypothetical protein